MKLIYSIFVFLFLGLQSYAFEYATFAGGCFWCMEPPFDKIEGVLETTSGYMGGHQKNPTYKDVSNGSSGHAEVVRVKYDPTKVSYEKLLDIFWHNIDPTTKDKQFVDIGSQYRTAIFYYSDEQKKVAIKSRDDLEKKNVFGAKIITEIVAATDFFEAEEYHQDFYKKSPVRYKFYRFNSGRDQYIQRIWGDKK
ncbi:peptide-methionine (S)-S-oxide reductase [Bacteriovorax sp. BSW11_IV]|uniref:peptide-methionine (S)-S-oxide reductase MsrA n=1 Tax=Bacteriovorax sp. BSW11_IV TaxID=1353529 RepID=UPI00038A499F|nr:peptide-methionine (S)-S-oxide reductase MsrA [Bacteriovorax sp. BSW11_IV]EQC49139.1 peptide-methionine (S)-S-oxide reductase [Bacteriovorax sp. BSW11_IV]